MTKRPTFDNLTPHYAIFAKTRSTLTTAIAVPAKMTLVHARALLSTEKMSSSAQNLKVSIGYYEVGQTGSKFVRQNSPIVIVQFMLTSAQSNHVRPIDRLH